MCFSLLWFVHLLIWLVCVAAAIAILRLLVPWLLELVGASAGPVPGILRIVIGAICAIILIWLFYDLVVCAMSLPALR